MIFQKFRKLLEKYREFKEDYLNRSPKGKWKFVRNIGTFLLKCCGVSVMEPDFKIYWYSYSTSVALFCTFASFIYTVWYYTNTDTPLKGFLFLPAFAVIIPVSKRQKNKYLS